MSLTISILGVLMNFLVYSFTTVSIIFWRWIIYHPDLLGGSFRKLAFSLLDPMIMCWKDARIGCFFSFFWYFSWGILFLKYIKTIVKCHQLVKFSKRVCFVVWARDNIKVYFFLHKIDMFWFILDCKNVFIEIKMFLLMLC